MTAKSNSTGVLGHCPSPADLRARRQSLIDDHLKLVYSLAIRVYRSIGGAIELDDLVAFGTVGLLQAAQRFEPTRNCAFSSFAYPRIRGAIYDGIRQLAPLPSSLYRRTLGDRRPTDQDPDTTAPAPFVTSLEAHIALGHQPVSGHHDAEQNVIANELSDLVQAAVARLSPREQELIHAHYYQDDTLQRAGRNLGISRSWACRLHARAIEHLRDSMATVGLAA